MTYRDKFIFFISLYSICGAYLVDLLFCDYLYRCATVRSVSIILGGILEPNKKFVKNKGYEKYITNKYLDKKVATLSCMDTRLTELLSAVLGIHNGDVKIIKNASAVISHSFGNIICGLLVAIIELGVEEIMIIAHSDCGACHMNSDEMIVHVKEWGIKSEAIDMIHYCGVDSGSWLGGFDDPARSARGTVRSIENHPLIPEDAQVHGFIIDSLTGKLTRAE